MAAGAEGADERNSVTEQLVTKLEEIAEQQQAARQRQQQHEEQEERNRAQGLPAGKEYVAVRRAEEEIKKLDREWSEIDRQIAAVRSQNDQYRKEMEAHDEFASLPERRKHFVLYGAGGAILGLAVGFALLLLDHSRGLPMPPKSAPD